MFIFQKFEMFSDTHSGAIGESFLENLLIKSLNQNIFEKIKLNRNLHRILFNPIQYGLFLKHYGMGGGGGIMDPLVTLLFLKVEQQNLVR